MIAGLGGGGMKFEINFDVRLIRRQEPKQFRTVVERMIVEFNHTRGNFY